jgi:hypothetical protein
LAISHRNSDLRACGATTIVQNQNFVFIDSQLWAVKGDPDSHGDGGLINSQDYVFINGIPIILVGDQAQPDDLCMPIGPPHCDPFTTSGDSLVNVN